MVASDGPSQVRRGNLIAAFVMQSSKYGFGSMLKCVDRFRSTSIESCFLRPNGGSNPSSRSR